MDKCTCADACLDRWIAPSCGLEAGDAGGEGPAGASGPAPSFWGKLTFDPVAASARLRILRPLSAACSKVDPRSSRGSGGPTDVERAPRAMERFNRGLRLPILHARVQARCIALLKCRVRQDAQNADSCARFHQYSVTAEARRALTQLVRLVKLVRPEPTPVTESGQRDRRKSPEQLVGSGITGSGTSKGTGGMQQGGHGERAIISAMPSTDRAASQVGEFLGECHSAPQ